MLRIFDHETGKILPLKDQDKVVNVPKSKENVGQDPRKPRTSTEKKNAKP